jgi:hypothetical protein
MDQSREDTESTPEFRPGTMLTNIGFFHFGDPDKSNPIDSLRTSLRTSETDNAGSLIVLPEAFNIRQGYRNCELCDVDWDMVESLQDISARSRISFVAGLIVGDRTTRELPYSCGCLICKRSMIPGTYPRAADQRAGVSSAI